ncbi:MAG: GNAT family protein [archaeon]
MTEELFLREAQKEDAALLAKWFNDKENVAFMTTHVRSSRHTARSIWKDIVDMKKLDPDYEKLFMVCIGEEMKPIGHAGFDEIDLEDRRGEIFFMIGEKEYKGRGFGTKIAEAVLDHAFNRMKLNSLSATISEDNKPSIAVTEKIGFKKVGIRREYNFINGRFVDEIFYDMTLKDYEGRNRLRSHGL